MKITSRAVCSFWFLKSGNSDMAKLQRRKTIEFLPPEEQKEFISGNPILPEINKSKNNRGRKSLKETEVAPENINLPPDEVLFQKQYYSMGEVVAMFGVKASLIRYWENEFDMVEPKKNRKGDRFFKPSDVKLLLLIYDLIRRRKFTLEGAREYLKKNRQAEEKFAMIQSLQRIKSFIIEMKAGL
jgi:DNA-binding transcriptional MerR regulator